jgi:hypothetical protein
MALSMNECLLTPSQRSDHIQPHPTPSHGRIRPEAGATSNRFCVFSDRLGLAVGIVTPMLMTNFRINFRGTSTLCRNSQGTEGMQVSLTVPMLAHATVDFVVAIHHQDIVVALQQTERL